MALESIKLTTMEPPMSESTFAAFVQLMISWASILGAWVGVITPSSILALAGTLVALISGALAGRYYWYAAKEKKQIVEQFKKNNKP